MSTINIDSIIDKIKDTINQKLSESGFVEKLKDAIIQKVSDTEFVQTVVDKGTVAVENKVRPYLYIGTALYALIIVLLLIIIYMIYKRK